MEYLLLTIIGILLVIIFALSAKVYFLRRSAQEIAETFREKMAADTNTQIDISTSDPYMRKLASEINAQLRLLRKEHHRYQQGDQELKTTVTNISHDLRTPLTAICGYLDLMEREYTNETTRRYLNQIQNRVEILKNLTEELFRYSIVTSTQELKLERLDVKRVLEESLLSFYVLMQEKQIQPIIDLPEEAVWRELDAGAVSRIFSNIISNAMKYSDGDFSVSMDGRGHILFSNAAKGLNSVIAEKLFDRFYTVEVSRNSSGLGLSIAKLLTEQMGGTITAKYQENRLYIELTLNQEMP